MPVANTARTPGDSNTKLMHDEMNEVYEDAMYEVNPEDNIDIIEEKINNLLSSRDFDMKSLKKHESQPQIDSRRSGTIFSA